MAFPLITEVQREREDAIRIFCDTDGLLWRITTGTDGSRFFDCYLPSIAADASVVVRAAVRELFGVAENDSLVFRGQGLAEYLCALTT